VFPVTILQDSQLAVARCGILSIQFYDHFALAPSILFSRLIPG